MIVTALALSSIGMMAQKKTVTKGELDKEDAHVWEKPDLSKETIKENGLTWRNILGTEESAADLYGVTFVPTYLLIVRTEQS